MVHATMDAEPESRPPVTTELGINPSVESLVIDRGKSLDEHHGVEVSENSYIYSTIEALK